ncbi:MAG TPA: extracellular solute-binding protein, partial [Anaerolineales bacterium]|nr:extracellular solute-binding protein [Anaerolineales bacterium]
MSKKLSLLFSLMLVLSFVLGACQPSATPTEETLATDAVQEPTEAVAPTEAVVEEPTEASAEEVPTEAPTEAPTEVPVEPTAVSSIDVDPTGQTVVFWHVWGSGSAAEGLAKIVADFNATNEWGITVEAIDQGNQGDLQTAVNAAVATGELPNVTPGFPNAMSTWYAAGAIAELNTYINDPVYGLTTDELAAIYPANLASGRQADGTQIGLPIHQSANVIFYNQTWAEELGFSAPPATAAEFKEQACAAAAANSADDNPDNDGTGG